MSDQEGLPERDTPAEVLGSIHYVLISLGNELGGRYDKVFRDEVGPNWVQVLSNLRKKAINPTDAQFVLSEPLRHPDSPARKVLPAGGAFFNQLEDALRVRNDWMHHDVNPIDLNQLWNSVDVIHRLATSAELRLGKLCSEIKKRIKEILNGQYLPGAPVVIDQSVELGALQAELIKAREREQTLVEEVGAAQALLEEAAQVVAPVVEPVEESKELEAELAAAEEKLSRLEFLVESLLASQEEKPHIEHETKIATPVSVLPGHRWEGPLPPRSTTLMGLQDDLFDPLISTGIGREFGENASSIISGWRKLVAPGATILVNAEGDAVSYIDGEPTYLGSLKGETSAPNTTARLAGFFTGHTYTLRLNGTVEDRDSGDTLSQVNPASAKKVGKKLKELIPNGGRLRVTTTGTIARYQDGEWVAVSAVRPEEWFPGQL